MSIDPSSKVTPSAGERLTRRFERERRARLEAEAIGERSTRAFYETQREIKLLQVVATAANEAKTVERAMQVAIDHLGAYTEWPIGHVYLVDRGQIPARMVPTNIWYCQPPVERFESFRAVTMQTVFPIGVGLPGRVLANGQPLWIVDVNRDSNFPRAAAGRPLGIRAGFGFPVLVERDVVAVIEFFTEHEASPDERLLRLVGYVGTQLGRVVERERSQHQLQQSEGRYRAVSELTSDYGYCFAIDPQGGVNVEWMAGAVKAVTGYTSEELAADNRGFLIVHPEDQPRALLRVQRLISGHTDVSEFRIIHKEGEVRWLRESGRPTFDESGKVVRVICAAQDVTERKNAEQQVQRLNAELERRVGERTAELSAANRELEAFSYSVSHDLRAPLRSINGFSQALLEDYSEKLDPQGRQYLQYLRSASQNMSNLIDALIGLARVTRTEMRSQSVDLSGLAEDIAAELQSQFPERHVEAVVAPGVTAEGDPRLLQILLENLIGNAWKYTGKREEARVEVGRGSTPQGEPFFFVRDNGVGFDMAYADKLFRPFQRLHARGEFSGDGIGLATVERIVRRHHGRVWAEGVVGAGATFMFTLGKPSERP